MEIDTQQLSTQLLNTQETSTTQQPVDNEQDNEIEETALNTDSTSEISDGGQVLASSTVTETSDTAEINNEADAQQSVEQFQQDAANDSSLTEQAQSSTVTSEIVESLIG